jgi:hypothetical protein
MESLHGIEWIMFHGHLDYFQKPPLGVGLTQDRETMALRMFTNVGLLCFIMFQDPHEHHISNGKPETHHKQPLVGVTELAKLCLYSKYHTNLHQIAY